MKSQLHPFAASVSRVWSGLLCLFVLSFGTSASAQTVFFSEDFDGANPGVSWTFMSTQSSNAAGGPITNLTPNGACNNYWTINSAHTPDGTNGDIGQRPKCNGFGSNFTFPNPDGGLNNNSLHITYNGSCALIAPSQTGQAITPPDSGDEYSYFNDPASPNANANSDRWAMINAPIDLSSAGNCGLQLQFDYYIGGDSLGQFTDRGVYISPDGGATWQEVENDIDYSANEWETFGDCKSWRTFTTALQGLGGNPNVLIAFRWRNQNPVPLDNSNFSRASGFNIDNIQIIQSLSGSQPELTVGPTPWCKNRDLAGSVTFSSIPQGTDPNSFNYSWSVTGPGNETFTNGTTPSDQNVSFQVDQNGSYSVQVVVTDPSTGCSQTLNDNITIQDCPPTAGLNTDATEVCATSPAPIGGGKTSLQTQDQSTSIPPITGYNWSATGPGTVSISPNNSDPSPSLSFSATGTYTITMQVTNTEGLTDDTVFTVEAIDCECTTPSGGGLLDTAFAEDFSGSPQVTPNHTGSGFPNAVTSSSTGGLFNNSWTVANSPAPGVTPPAAYVTNDVSFIHQWLAPADNPSDRLVLKTDAFSTTGLTGVEVEFDWINEMCGELFYRVGGTNPWVSVAALDAQGSWTTFTQMIPALDNQAQVELAFVFNFGCPQPIDDPSLGIDNILVTGMSGGGGTEGVFTCPLPSPLCPGQTLDVPYNAIGTFNAGNTFTVELSDATGSFASPTVLGTQNASGTNLTGQVQTVTIPMGTAPGTGYRIRVTASNASTSNFVDNGSDLEILPLPTAGPITGDSVLCVNTPGVIYTTPDNGFNLSWGIANGGDANNNVIAPDTFRVDWGPNPTAGTPDTVFAIASNSCGADTTQKPITLIEPDSLTPITGDSSICAPATGNYRVDNHNGSTYEWTTQAGTITTAPQDTNEIDIDWSGVPDGTYVVEVKETNLCNEVDSTQFFVQVTPSPTSPGINGPTTFCVNDTAVYSVTPEQGVNYSWDVLSGPLSPITGSLPQQGSSISLETTGSGTATIEVTAFNGCGNATQTLNVDVTNTFDFNGIAGNDTLCEPLMTETYNVPFIVGASYNWSITGGTIVGSTNGSSADVDWDPAAPNHELRAEIMASCGTDEDTLEIDIFPPQPAVSLTASADSACNGDNLTFNVNPALPPADVNYTWTVPSGWGTPAFNADSSQMDVNAGNNSGLVSVDVSTVCGTTSLDTNVTIVPPPGTAPNLVNNGLDTLCPGPGESTSLAVTNFDGAAFDYSWNVPGNLTITSPAPDTNQTETFEGTSGGTGTVTVDASNLCGSITSNPVDVEVITNLSIDDIVGTTGICASTTQQTYVAETTPDSAGAASYSWTANGGNILGSSSDTTVTVDWNFNAPAPLELTLDYSRAGCAMASQTITIDTFPDPNVTSLAGPDSVCNGASESYNVSPVLPTNEVSYDWTVPAGWTIDQHNADSSQIDVTPGSNGGDVEVLVTTGCGSATVTQTVTVESAPAAPTLVNNGLDTLCIGESTDFRITNFDANLTYSWTSSPEVNLSSAPGDGQTETFDAANAGTATITAEAANACNTAQSSIQVEVIDNLTIDAINGVVDVCKNDDVQDYLAQTTPDSGGNAQYTWSVTGGSILGSSTDTTVTVDWDTSASAPELNLSVQRGTACQDQASQPINLIDSPDQFSINGPIEVCAGDQVTYSVQNVGTNYNWTAPAGFVINSGQGTPSVTGTWTGSTGAPQPISVDITTANCGTGTSTLDVNVGEVVLNACSASPSTVETGNSTNVNANVSGGTPPYTVDIDFGDGAQTTVTAPADGPIPATPHTYVNMTGTNVTQTVNISVTDANGCTGSCSFDIVVTPPLDLDLDNNVPGDDICIGDDYAYTFDFVGLPAGTVAELQLSSDNFATDSTVVSSFLVDSITSPFAETLSFPPSITPGVYTLRVSSGAPNFRHSDTVQLTISPLPFPEITVQPDTLLILPEDATVDFLSTSPTPPQDVVRFEWSFSDTALVRSGPNLTEISRTFEEPGQVIVTLLMEGTGGCVNSTQKQITIEQQDAILIPNAFTPNGDGINDDFVATVRGPVESVDFALFNRWGEEILAKNLQGAASGQLTLASSQNTDVRDMPEGVYVYHAVFTLTRGRKISRTGTVTVVR